MNKYLFIFYIVLQTAILAFLAGFASATELRDKIAVIDTGIKVTPSIFPYLCEGIGKDFTGHGLIDVDGHGSNITELIARNLDPKKQCLLILKFYHTSVEETTLSVRAILYAVALQAKYINMSYSGPDYSEFEFKALSIALISGITLIAAAGNNAINFDTRGCYVYPACYNFNRNFYVVGNFQNGFPTKSSNFGGPVKYFEDGVNVYAAGVILSGTSQSTAIFLGKLIKRRTKQ